MTSGDGLKTILKQISNRWLFNDLFALGSLVAGAVGVFQIADILLGRIWGFAFLFVWIYAAVAVWRSLGLFSMFGHEDAARFLDDRFDAKDRFLSTLSSAVELSGTDQRRRILEEQSANLLSAKSPTLPPLRCTKALISGYAVFFLGLLLILFQPEVGEGGALTSKDAQARIEAVLAQNKETLPQPVAAALQNLSDQLLQHEVSSVEVQEAIKNAEQEISQAQEKLKQQQTEQMRIEEPKIPLTPTPEKKEQEQGQSGKQEEQSQNQSEQSSKDGNQDKKQGQQEDLKESKGGQGEGKQSGGGQGEEQSKDSKGSGEGKDDASKGEQGTSQKQEGQGKEGKEEAKNQQGEGKQDNKAQGKQQGNDGKQDGKQNQALASAQAALNSLKPGEGKQSQPQQSQSQGKSGEQGKKDSSQPGSEKGESAGKQGEKSSKDTRQEQSQSKDSKDSEKQDSEKKQKDDSKGKEGASQSGSGGASYGTDSEASQIMQGKGKNESPFGKGTKLQDTEVGEKDEQLDYRFLDKEGALAKNTKDAKPKTDLSGVTLSKPEDSEDKGKQPIPLEYRDILD